MGLAPTPSAAIMRKANWAIDKVTADLANRFAFNTAIAAVMELINELTDEKRGDAEPGVFASRSRQLRRCCSRSRRIRLQMRTSS